MESPLQHKYTLDGIYNMDESNLVVGERQASRALANTHKKSSWTVIQYQADKSGLLR
jgi:hypothetical protein